MNKVLLILLLIISLGPNKVQAQKIYGHVSDNETGEKLIGAVIYLPQLQQGITTNAFGHFSINIKNVTKIRISYIGYQSIIKELSVLTDTNINFQLEPGINIKEVTVIDSQTISIHKQLHMSTLNINMQDIQRMPNFFGEANILKAYQTMPGIVQGTETTSALHVRGGSPDQNRILLDDAPIYYINHYAGFFSIFNDDAILSSKLISGGFPAKYGGRLSSILDVRMKDGNSKKLAGNVSLGIFASKIMIEGPLLKDKATFMISARVSVIDKLNKIYQIIKNEARFGYGFYDINAKLKIKLNKKNNLLISYYLGNDSQSQVQKEEEFDSKSRYTWGNHVATIRLNHIFSPKLFSNISLIYSQYKFGFETYYKDHELEQKDKFTSKISDAILKANLNYYLNNNIKVNFGGTITEHFYAPGLLESEYSILDDSISKSDQYGSDNYNALESNIYAEIEHKLNKNISYSAGIHASLFNVNKANYYSVEPRLSLNISTGRFSSIKASFSTMKQYQHLLTYPGGGMPTDLWVSATNNVKPQKSWISAVGFTKTITSINSEFSTELYYKKMDNLIEYSEGSSFFTGDDWQNKIEKEGWGQSYGIEFLFQKKAGSFTGWISYCWSKSTRQFDEINYGDPYPYRYDRTHNFNTVLLYTINKRINITGIWRYFTGESLTLGSGKYPTLTYNSSSSQQSNLPEVGTNPAITYNGRNLYKGEPTHRLDIGINFIKEKKRGIRTWNISIYNVYARKNPSYYLYKTENGITTLNKVTEYMVLPSISYSFKF